MRDEQTEWALTSSQTDPDFDEHLRTYRGFLAVLRWSVVASALVLIFLAIWGG